MDFRNVLNLTPRVYRSKKTKQWLFDQENCYVANDNKEEVEYCLGVTIEAILQKESYYRLHRYRPKPIKLKFVTKQDTFVYEKSCVNSLRKRKIKKGEEFSIERTLPGLDEQTLFVRVIEFKKYDGKMEHLYGYILDEHGIFPELKKNSV